MNDVETCHHTGGECGRPMAHPSPFCAEHDALVVDPRLMPPLAAEKGLNRYEAIQRRAKLNLPIAPADARHLISKMLELNIDLAQALGTIHRLEAAARATGAEGPARFRLTGLSNKSEGLR